jgi:hypothetical protein
LQPNNITDKYNESLGISRDKWVKLQYGLCIFLAYVSNAKCPKFRDEVPLEYQATMIKKIVANPWCYSGPISVVGEKQTSATNGQILFYMAVTCHWDWGMKISALCGNHNCISIDHLTLEDN